jgi:hypothetical protein
MITKTVTSGQRSATATISEETKFIFSDAWNFYHVQNLGTGVVHVSMSAGATAGADGTIAIPAGGTACTTHGYPANTVYVTSSDATSVVQVIGSNSAISPFKSAAGGGGSSGTVTWGSIVGKPTFASIALSGSYADLINKPTIPIVDNNLSMLSDNAIKNKTVAEALQNLENEIDSITGGVSYVGYFASLTDRDNYSGTLIDGNWCTIDNDSLHGGKKTKYIYTSGTWIYNGEVSDTAISIDDMSGLGDTDKALSADQIVRRLNTQANTLQSAIALCAPVSSAHYHSNKSVLDKFSESDGKPLYNGAGIGGDVVVDSSLSDTSTNPVQNKVVNAALADKSNSDHIQAANKGGTGQTGYTVGDILYADTTTTLAKLAAGAADTVLTSNGTGVAPEWKTPTGSGGITQTLLYNGLVAKYNTYTLASAITNFKFLLLFFSTHTNSYKMCNVLTTEVGDKYVYYWDTTVAAFKTDYLTFTSATTFTSNNTNSYIPFELWGVK